jgi:DNA end-binding protein Ku
MIRHADDNKRPQSRGKKSKATGDGGKGTKKTSRVDRARTSADAPPPQASPGPQAPPARPMWSGTLTFGLVSVPVNLVAATREGRVPMHMLDADGSPLNRRYYCPADDQEVHPEHILRGYEIEPERYIVVRDEELDAFAPDKSRDIDLRRFVNADAIDPIYFNRAYFLTPAAGSNKAYRLLAETMEKTKRAGIATFVMRDKEYLVAIFAEAGLLRAQTLRFEDEVRTPEDVGLPAKQPASKSDVQKFAKSIRKLTRKTLDESELTDHYSERVLKLLEGKQAEGRDVVESAPAEAESEVEDLIAALRASMAKAPRSKG